MVNWDALPNFSRDEFVCKCGECDRADMDADFMDSLQTLRSIMQFGFPISSGFRCPSHNIQVSKTGPNGPHTTGKAADILCERQYAHKLCRVAFSMFSGIGLSQKGGVRFIHLDSLPEGQNRPTVWTY